MSVKGLKDGIKFLHCKWVQSDRATGIWKMLLFNGEGIFTT